MGIELDYLTRTRPVFQARCDNCDTYLELDATTPANAGVKLRDQGWRRSGYLPSHNVYMWNCPKCKDPR